MNARAISACIFVGPTCTGAGEAVSDGDGRGVLEGRFTVGIGDGSLGPARERVGVGFGSFLAGCDVLLGRVGCGSFLVGCDFFLGGGSDVGGLRIRLSSIPLATGVGAGVGVGVGVRVGAGA